ncbi:MAG: SUMF1/EgtB/PvdO family nonheme iron enzyme, partial [Candidatus Eremiobacterota bacterium]
SVTVDISSPGTYTATVADVPVGLNEATIEILDVNDMLLAMRKHGFQMDHNGDVNAGKVIMGVSLDPSGGLHCDPNYIEIKKGEILYVENQDTGTEYSVTIGSETHSVSAATASVPPVTAATFPAEAFGTFSGTVGTYSITAGGTTVGNVLVYDVPSISGFTPGSGDEGETVTINGSFYLDPANATVTFNGVSTPVLAGSDGTHLLVAVPAGATTGKISVTTPGGTKTSEKYFYPMELRTDDTCNLSQFVPPTITFSHDFYVGRYEITNAQYRLWPAAASHHGYVTELNNSTYDNYPVRYVNWMDVCQYCNWLSSEEGLTSCYTIGNVSDHNTYALNLSANGYRLPTEAEWEYACRGGTATNYYWGDALDAATGLNKCWYGFYSSPQGTCTTGLPAPVGYGGSHPWGLYDMSGNLWEWCHNNWESSPAGGSDPVGPGAGSYRVYRGGCWIGNPGDCRSACRQGGPPVNRGVDLGFRPVRTVP